MTVGWRPALESVLEQIILKPDHEMFTKLNKHANDN